jgi:putative endonuclease
MQDYIVTGKKGEDLAAEYIRKLGFNILERNWRYRRSEIDLIACEENVLHFIEVKTRTSLMFGYPEEGVSKKKIKALLRGGSAYLAGNPCWKQIQYDIVSILLIDGVPPELLYIKDIYL